MTLTTGPFQRKQPNYLEKDNTVVFVPTGDYNPTTKKYVDDAEITAGSYAAGDITLTKGNGDVIIDVSSLLDDTNTHIGNSDLTVTAARDLDLNGFDLTFSNGVNDRFVFQEDGVFKWGLAAAHGALSWDTNKTRIIALSGNSLSLGANGSDDKLWIDGTTYNVGINTITPTLGKLHVKQSIDNVASGIAVEGISGGNSGRMYINGSDFILQKGSNTNQLVLDATGNIGVSTDSLGYKVTVQQTVDDNGVAIYGYDDRSSDYILMHVGSTGNGTIITNNSLALQPSSGYIYLNSGREVYYDVGSSAYDHLFRDGAGGNLLTIYGGGDVKIHNITASSSSTNVLTSNGGVIESRTISSLGFDNYGSWNLKSNGTQRTTVTSGGTLDLVNGNDISIVYSAGGVMTIHSTFTESDTLDTVTSRGATTTNNLTVGSTLNLERTGGVSIINSKLGVGENDTQFIRFDESVSNSGYVWIAVSDDLDVSSSNDVFYVGDSNLTDWRFKVTGNGKAYVRQGTTEYELATKSYVGGYLPLTGGTLTGELGSLRGDTGYTLRTYNDSAAGDPEQFFIKHDFHDTQIGNLRGNIEITDGNLTVTENVQANTYKISGSTILQGAATVQLGSGGTTGIVNIQTVGDTGTINLKGEVNVSELNAGTANTFVVESSGTLQSRDMTTKISNWDSAYSDSHTQGTDTSINSSVGSGIVVSTTGTLSTITNNSTNWDTAYGWGDHSGVYIPIGDYSDFVNVIGDSMQGTLSIEKASGGIGLCLWGANQDVDLVMGTASTGSYGYYWRYKGTGSGVNNTLDHYTDNQGGTDIQVYSQNQDGVRNFLVSPTISGNVVWNAGNDGAGSTLDADLLDAQHGSYYLDYNNFTNLPNLVDYTGTPANNQLAVFTDVDTVEGNSALTWDGTVLAAGTGTTDNVIRSYYSDGSYTEMRGYGLFMNRSTSYIRPTADNTQSLNIGSLSNAWGYINLDYHNGVNFYLDEVEVARFDNSGYFGLNVDPTVRFEVNAGADAEILKVYNDVSSNAGATPGYGFRIKGTAVREHTIYGSSSADYNLVLSNAGTGEYNLNVGGELIVENVATGTSDDILVLDGTGLVQKRTLSDIFAEGDEHIGNTDLTLTSDRDLDLNNFHLYFTDGAANRFEFTDDGTFKWGAGANDGVLSWDAGETRIYATSEKKLTISASGYSTSGITVSPTNDVGIGDSTPTSKLDVHGNLRVGTGYNNIAAPTNGAIIEGNLGVGTSSPDELIEASGAAPAIKITGSTGAAVLKLSGSDAEFNLIAQTTTDRFDIFDVTAAATRLSIAGTTGYLTIHQIPDSTSESILVEESNVVKKRTFESLSKWKDEGGTGPDIYYDSGNVIIGDTTGAYPLTVKGTGTVAKFYGDGVGQVIIEGHTDNSGLVINSGTDGLGTEESAIWFYDNGSPKWELYKNTANHFTIYDYTRTAIVFEIQDNGNMKLMENGGNVQVGSTSSTCTLSVGGTFCVDTIAHETTDVDKFLVSNGGTLKYRTGAEVLSDTGAVPTTRTVAGKPLSSDVSLNGADVGLGNVPNTDATIRSNHTGTQTASTISDFDTEVSNNTTVVGKFDKSGGTIDGTVIIDTDSGNQPFYISRNGATSETLKMYTSDSTTVIETIQDETTGLYGSLDIILDSGAPNPELSVKHGSTDVMKVVKSGNSYINNVTAFGIGKDNPSTMLDVNGTVTATTFDGALDWSNITNKPTIPSVEDTAYGAGWNGDTDAASKNAIYDEMETKADKQKTQSNQTSNKTIIEASGYVFTNTGATGTITFTLPDGSAGDYYDFVVVATQSLRVAPPSSGVIYGPNTYALNYIYSPLGVSGNTVRLYCTASKTWYVMGPSGTWTYA